MPQKRREPFALETEWVRGYARAYLPSECGFSFSPELLRQAGLSLVGVRNVMRRGTVVFADKLDGPGAIWIVEGKDTEGEKWKLELTVVSEIISVTLRAVKKIEVEAAKVEVRERSNGAA